jgi:streptogramin lyase
MQFRFLDWLAEHSKASGRLDRHQQRFTRHAVPAEADGLV